MDKELQVKKEIHKKIPIDCGKVIVRKYKIQDVSLFCKYTSDNALIEYLLCSTSKGVQAVQRFILGIINEYKIEQATRFIIANKETNKLMGAISIYISNEGKDAELGYWIGKEHWGHGYMSSVVCNIVDTLKGIQDIERIFIEADVNNTASIKVAKKAGLHYNEALDNEKQGRQLLIMEYNKEKV